jgi:hypothetical protein
LKEDLSQSISERISLDPKIERICQIFKDSAQDPLPEQITKYRILYILNTATDRLYYIDPTDTCKKLVILPGLFRKELLILAYSTTYQGIPRIYYKVAPGFFWKGL